MSERAAVGQAGFALPVTLFVLVLLALLAAALAGATTAELQGERLADWDRRVLYVAEAGLEHQIYRLKGDRNAGPVGTVSLGGSPWTFRYTVDARPAAPGGQCRGVVADAGWWEIRSVGQLVQGATVVHSRTVDALVEIQYLVLVPTRVTVCWWRSS